jgi:4-hydroxy-4-methyl-2-oxoglutarate aldolase
MSPSFARLFREQYSTALIADAAFRADVPVGVMPSALNPLRPGTKIAGPAVTVICNNDLVAVLGAVHRASAGDVVVISNPAGEAGVIGDLIGTEARRKGLAGFIVDGLVRDSQVLVEMGVAVFCRNTIPVGPLKLPPELKGIGTVNQPIVMGNDALSPGDWLFADDDGAIWLPAAALETVFDHAEESQQREAKLFEEMKTGTPLGDLLQLDEFLRQRESDPAFTFNEHLKKIGRAI